MTFDSLIACLNALQPPAGVEEWLRPNHSSMQMTPSNDYQRAVWDVLVALGGIADTGEVTSPMAYYFIQSLIYAIQEGTLSEKTWQADVMTDTCTGTGVQLVHLLESHRLTCGENPTPLRTIQAVTAVIKARRDGGDVYLMQYDEKANQFQPIGGKRELTDASAEAALTRELCEELAIPSLTPGEDFQLRPLAKHVGVREVSASIHVITQYDHSLYHLTEVRFPIQTDQWTRWLSAPELAARRTVDGYPITPLFEDFIPGVLPTLDYSLANAVS